LSLQLLVVNQSAQKLDHMSSTLAPARDVADWRTFPAEVKQVFSFCISERSLGYFKWGVENSWYNLKHTTGASRRYSCDSPLSDDCPDLSGAQPYVHTATAALGTMEDLCSFLFCCFSITIISLLLVQESLPTLLHSISYPEVMSNLDRRALES
jgi:hypothetical protein